MAIVTEIGKFGFVADGKRYRYADVAIERVKIVPGALINLDNPKTSGAVTTVFIGNQKDTEDKTLIVSGEIPEVVGKPTVDTERAKKFTPKFTKKEDTNNSMSKEEWAQKDQRISRQGVIQAAVIALAPVVSLEQLPSEAVKLATAMLEFVNPK